MPDYNLANSEQKKKQDGRRDYHDNYDRNILQQR